ncbi:MAG TPA: T9SS type A sorting domain-containing protein [Flavobacterium sp.]|jgi:hypothetical protein
MKHVMYLSFLVVSYAINAQLHISSGNYVYVQNKMLYVKENVDIASNATLYLRDNAQLLQASPGLSTNAGVGDLSVYQEGTTDNFEFNYWCSPVGTPSASSGNQNFGISLLNNPSTVMNSAPAILLPTTAYDGAAAPFAIASRWIYKFLTSSNYSQWVQVASASNILPGQGFTMKGTSGTDNTTIFGVANNSGSAQRYDFRGRPNDGNIPITVAFNQFTLTGNPYPSAIDLSAFLTEALQCTGVAYFWEQDKNINSHVVTNYRGGYGTYSPISRGGLGIYIPAPFYGYDLSGNQLSLQSLPLNIYPRYFAPVGQGFMIEGSLLGSTVTMKNEYRVYQKENFLTSVFERPATSLSSATPSTMLDEVQSVSGFDYTIVNTSAVPHIQFNATVNNFGFHQFVLAFDEAATDAADHAMDAKSPNTTLPTNIFFVIDDMEYVISVIDFDVNKRLPLGFKCNEAANFKMTVSQIVNFEAAENVFIYDKQTGAYHDIKNGIFEITLPSGVDTTRFELTFTQSNLGLDDTHSATIDIHQDNANQLLIVRNQQLLNIKSVMLYDVAGRLILQKTGLGTSAESGIPTSGLSEGVYVVKVITDQASKGQKIIVRRNNN